MVVGGVSQPCSGAVVLGLSTRLPSLSSTCELSLAPHQHQHHLQVQERILEENLEVEISSDPIQLTIHSPDVHNVTLVDLPGYIHVIKKGQSSGA